MRRFFAQFPVVLLAFLVFLAILTAAFLAGSWAHNSAQEAAEHYGLPYDPGPVAAIVVGLVYVVAFVGISIFQTFRHKKRSQIQTTRLLGTGYPPRPTEPPIPPPPPRISNKAICGDCGDVWTTNRPMAAVTPGFLPELTCPTCSYRESRFETA